MMDTLLILRLQPSQVSTLLASCAAYRGMLWQTVLPSPARNQDIRVIQGVQARLEHMRVQANGGALNLPLSTEEGKHLQQLLLALIHQTNSEPDWEQRARKREDLAGLLLLVERARRDGNG